MRNTDKRVFLLILVLLLSLLLNGCGMKNAVLDEQMRIVVSALNDKNPDRLIQQIYPGPENEALFLDIYTQILGIWTPVEQDSVKLVNVYTYSSSGEKTYRGIYRYPQPEGDYYLQIEYAQTKEASGIYALYVTPVDTVDLEQKDAGLSWMSISDGICFVVALFTIVDILRKKPNKYGWYILLAIFTFRFYTLNIGVTTFSLRLPLGSIIYWCLRKKLLRKKAEKLAAEAEALDEVLSEETPPEDMPLPPSEEDHPEAE